MDRDQFYRGLHLEPHEAARHLHPDNGRQLARSLFGRWDAQRTEWLATAGETQQVLRQELQEKPRCGHFLPPQPGQGR